MSGSNVALAMLVFSAWSVISPRMALEYPVDPELAT
jgi:hypothetical protein